MVGDVSSSFNYDDYDMKVVAMTLGREIHVWVSRLETNEMRPKSRLWY
jgi:hypothetical protein